MTLFVLTCIGLILVAILFCRKFLTGTDIRIDSHSANLAWYSVRRREISLEERNSEDLSTDARFQTLSDMRDINYRQHSDNAFPKTFLAIFVIAVGMAIYYFLGSIEDVLLTARINTIDSVSNEEELSLLMIEVEERLLARPNNADYLNLAAQYRLAQGDFDRGLIHMRKLVNLLPDDAYVLGSAARASFLANERQLDEEGRAYAQRSLALDSKQEIALSVLGFSALSENNYTLALDFLSRLLLLQNPQSEDRLMLQSFIAEAQQRVVSGSSRKDSRDNDTTYLAVEISFPRDADVKETDILFVSVRDIELDTRMPALAVKRHVGNIKGSIEVSDRDSLIGQKLSDLENIEVFARISPSGQVGEAHATWAGSARLPTLEQGKNRVEILLEPKEF